MYMNEIFTITSFASIVTFFIFSMNQIYDNNPKKKSETFQNVTQKATFNTSLKPMVRKSYSKQIEKKKYKQNHDTLVYKTISKNGKVSYSNTNTNLERDNKSVKVFRMKPAKVTSKKSSRWLTPKPQDIIINHVYIQRNYSQINNDTGETSLKTCRFYKRKFQWFSERMRRGYTNSERDWLESNRVKYRDLLFNNCDSHKLL